MAGQEQVQRLADQAELGAQRLDQSRQAGQGSGDVDVPDFFVAAANQIRGHRPLDLLDQAGKGGLDGFADAPGFGVAVVIHGGLGGSRGSQSRANRPIGFGRRPVRVPVAQHVQHDVHARLEHPVRHHLLILEKQERGGVFAYEQAQHRSGMGWGLAMEEIAERERWDEDALGAQAGAFAQIRQRIHIRLGHRIGGHFGFLGGGVCGQVAFDVIVEDRLGGIEGDFLAEGPVGQIRHLAGPRLGQGKEAHLQAGGGTHHPEGHMVGSGVEAGETGFQEGGKILCAGMQAGRVRHVGPLGDAAPADLDQVERVNVQMDSQHAAPARLEFRRRIVWVHADLLLIGRLRGCIHLDKASRASLLACAS